MRITTLAALVACATFPMTVCAQTMDVPDAVKAPAGNKPAMTLKGAGDLTYECKTNAAGAMEWTFAGPMATLTDTRTGQTVGKYYGGPTWEAMEKQGDGQAAIGTSSRRSIPAARLPSPRWARMMEGHVHQREQGRRRPWAQRHQRGANDRSVPGRLRVYGWLD
jgi:hypothetical protein